MSPRSFTDDLNYGNEKELLMLTKLTNYFTEDVDIKSTKELYPNNKYCKWDFEDATGVKWELKSRRNTYNRYPTTIIPCHKTNNNDTEKGLYFVFQFTDGDYYIAYNAELFATFATRMIKINRVGKYDPPTLHWEIPIELLTIID